MVVAEGVTETEPLGSTVPIPLSMLTESALLLVQLRVALLPAVMDVGAADRETVGARAGSVPPAVTVSVSPAVLEAGSAESVTAGVEADSDTLSVSVSVEQPNKLNTVKIMNSSSIFFTGNLKAML